MAAEAAVMAHVAVDASPLAGIAGAALPLFLTHAGGHPADHLDDAVRFRRADPDLTGPETALPTRAADLVRSTSDKMSAGG